MFLYFEILYIFLVFLNYLKTCVTQREQSDKHQKGKKIILVFFKLFGRKCHTTRAVAQTQ